MQACNPSKVMITGGAGFIGSALVRYLLKQGVEVINIDKLTYAGHLSSLAGFDKKESYHFYPVDICDAKEIRTILTTHKPNGIIHLAAESHVDRSIDSPSEFIKTNVLGTYTLLQESLKFWREHKDQRNFRFHHVSTDEVYGSLGPEGYFSENSLYQPNSPYSATKASADHLVRAWHHTYGLPISMSNCSNNYGPYQLPEKLIPNMIIRSITGNALPIYGNGQNIRDWLYVEDHVEAIWMIFKDAQVGETYLIGGQQERTNQYVVECICQILDKILPRQTGLYSSQIEYLKDRPGHDKRYAINSNKLMQNFNWKPSCTFEQGLEKTILWYLDNATWWQEILMKQNIMSRQGVF